jgi:hypothetical protein
MVSYLGCVQARGRKIKPPKILRECIGLAQASCQFSSEVRGLMFKPFLCEVFLKSRKRSLYKFIIPHSSSSTSSTLLLLLHRQLSLLSPNFYKTDKAVQQLLYIMSGYYSSSSDESNQSRSSRRSYLSNSSASTVGSAYASNIVLKLPSGKRLIFALSECKNFVVGSLA